MAGYYCSVLQCAVEKNFGNNNDDYDDESILNDPKWLSIVQLGVVAKRTLTDMLGERETNVLNEEIDYLKYQ